MHTASQTAPGAGESELIHHARQGNSLAWETLIRACQENVFRLAYLMLGDAEQAEDTAQEAFIQAYRAIGRFDVERPFQPWILSIAANLARNRRRSAGRYLAALNRLFQAERHAHPTSVEEMSAAHWNSTLLWQAIRKLPLDDQQIIYLRFFLGMSVEETAQTMNLAAGTVKSRLHRALHKLKIVIERDFPALVGEDIGFGSGL